jgi:hypothetical protein
MSVKVREVTGSESELLTIYPGQFSPQDAFLELDCREEVFTAEWNGEIGYGVPMDVWEGHTLRFGIPLLRTSTVNQLLHDLESLAERVCAGYESEWTGSNWRPVFTEDARNAIAEIESRLEGLEADLYWAAADEWLDFVRQENKDALGTGKSIDALMDELDGDGTDEEHPVLINLREYLEDLAAQVLRGEEV